MYQDTALPFSPIPLSRNRAFMLFWSGQTVSFVGSAMAMVAWPVLVLQSTGRVAQMGLVTALMAAGSLIAGLVAGVLADCLDVRTFMLTCDAALALLYGIIPLTWVLVGAQVALLYVLAVPLGFLTIASTVAATACLPRLVDQDQLTLANSRFQTGYALAYLAGPLLAGVLFGLVSAEMLLGLNALSYVVSVCSLLSFRLRPASVSSLPATLDREGILLAGVRWLGHDARLRWTVLLRVGALGVMGGALDLVVYRLRHELQQSNAIVAIVYGSSALGALVAGLLTPMLRRRLGFGPTFLGGLVLLGGSLLVIGLESTVGVFLVLGMCLAFGDIVAQIVAAALIQELTPSTLQGRVAAAMQLFLWLGTALGAAAETFSAAQLGYTSPVFVVMGLVILSLAALGLVTPARQIAPDRLPIQER